MSSTLKIAFLWDWEPEYHQTLGWEDGLAAAIREIINRGHEVSLFVPGDEANTIKHPYFDIRVTDDVVKEIGEFDPDVILHWADMTRPHALSLQSLGKPMAICFAGGEPFAENVELFDHIFVESEVYKKRFEEKGYSVSTAFGTNTELFQPQEQPIMFDTILPATFALWKRHDLYANATHGLRALAVGYMYKNHEKECWQTCINHGVMVLPHLPAYALPRLYASCRVVAIPSQSDGGSQRTVLEAMAMNIPVVVADSDKFDFAEGRVLKAEPNAGDFRRAIDEAFTRATDTRGYILKNWSEHNYADSIIKGLESIT